MPDLTLYIFYVFIISLALSPNFPACNVAGCFRRTKDDYIRGRNDVIAEEFAMKLGSEIQLDAAEKELNALLMRYKISEMSSSAQADQFPPRLHFFKAKPLIEKSQVFHMIKKMPKGGALHLHDTSMVNVNWLIKNVTYRPDCYVCFNLTSGAQRMKFFRSPPSNADCPWRRVSDVRGSYPSRDAYDKELYLNMTLVTADPHKKYPSEAVVWKAFESKFFAITDLIFFKNVFKDYFYEALSEFYTDNVQFIEFRALLGEAYDLDGKLYGIDYLLQAYQNATAEFVATHPDFSGAKMIYSSLRMLVNASTIQSAIERAIKLRVKYPDFVSGFDLVGWEQSGGTLISFIDQLLYPSQLKPPVHLPYFFHAGETDWEGTATDANLYDAILLNASRIGHGYAVIKHPKLLQLLKKKDIPIEVNPISNQVLNLVSDLRNHPASFLIANNYSIVVSSDDPAMWGADPLSHDFYEIFMGVAGAKADLKFLKRLAMNSIRYSSMTPKEKTAAFAIWSKKWKRWIDATLKTFGI